MSKKTRLKIGEFSQLMQVSVKTLRYYEQRGLLAPDEVDEWTGYRYYSIEQMQKLKDIRDLQRLGFEYCGKQHLYAENTGWTDFYFYEYVGIKIAELERNQWDDALQLVKEVFMEFEAPDYPDEGIADFMHAIGDEIYLNMHRCYGAYEDDRLVGVIATRNYHHHIGLLFVDKNYQRRGIGKQLILHILKQKDDKPITVNASPYGHEFYKKLGFKDTDVEQVTNGVRYYPMINNDDYKLIGEHL